MATSTRSPRAAASASRRDRSARCIAVPPFGIASHQLGQLSGVSGHQLSVLSKPPLYSGGLGGFSSPGAANPAQRHRNPAAASCKHMPNARVVARDQGKRYAVYPPMNEEPL